ncbi:hypothetical protein E8E12_000036, partial [Didymella heteroderae]
ESLEYYLQLPADRGYKVVHRPNDVKMTYLKKLEHVARSMGCNVVLSYKEVLGAQEMEEARQQSLRQLQDAFLKDLPEQPTEFMQLYQELGGDYHTIVTDLEQVRKMRFLRIKIDVATRSFREATRESVRDHLRDLFCRSIPARRLWMYLKGLRQMSLGDPNTTDMKDAESFDGPEDVIVKAQHIVRPECLGLLLHFTVMQDIQHRLTPGLNPSSGFTLDETGLERVKKITRLTFAPVGSIRDCGIRPIQDHAIQITNM